ncbi:MAG: ABC transporter ATP-binding protein/permease [Proteobacteria bacterium]|jgi:subfamily B ATP-binding cassette protein MsbA|nr:ABC transporter ATP-binding protein/permease [Pseudomonadota bacterium]
MNGSRNDDATREAPPGRIGVGSLLALARPASPLLAAAAACMAVSAAATAGYAYLVGPVLRFLFGEDAAFAAPVAGAPHEAFGEIGAALAGIAPWQLAAVLVAAAAIKGFAFFASRVASSRAGQRVLFRLRNDVYRSLLALDPFGEESRRAGAMVSRFAVDVEAVEQALTDGLMGFVRDALQIAALVVLILALDPVLGALGLLAFPLAALSIVRLGRALRRRRRDVHEAFEALGESVSETAAGLHVVRAFRAEPLMRARFEAASLNLAVRAVRAATLRALSSPFNEILGAAALGATLMYANARIAQGALTAGEVASFFTALALLYQPVKGLGQDQSAVQSGLAALDRLAVLREDERRSAARPAAPFTAHPGPFSVEIRGLVAGYPGCPEVLRCVDLVVPKGARLAIVGGSGSGKTTLLNALGGLLEPRGGELLVDGVRVDPRSFAASGAVATVPQEPFLFDDGIAMNVRIGRPSASDEEVIAACRVAGVLGFAGELPGRLEERIGRRGARLSVGQRQRVCLARALLSAAPLLLFDEITASLDGATERALVEGLDGYLGERSVVVVTHRLSTARWASRLALLEGGVMRAEGPAGQLLESDPRVRSLFEGAPREEDCVA